MELLFGIYGRCFLAVGDILWVYFFSTTMRLMQVPCMCVRRFGAWLI